MPCISAEQKMLVSFPFPVFCEKNKDKFQQYSLGKSMTDLGVVDGTNLGELCWEEKISEVVSGNLSGF